MITTVTLNASIDKAYTMDGKLQNGTVMRVAACHNTAGGKGLNVARTVKLCGRDVQAAGLCGGFNGQYLRSMLKRDGIEDCFTEVAGETRSCINILDSEYGSTEYLEPGEPVTPEEAEGFINSFPEIIKGSDVVTLSGSAPKGFQKDIYARLVAMAKEQGKKVILDTSRDFLKEGLRAAPTMVKPNEDEIELLFGVRPRTLDEVIAYAKRIAEMGIPYVVVSLGKNGALLVCENGIWKGTPPKLHAVNPVGCGDSMVGAFAVAMERGDAPDEALRFAISVATGSALSPSTGNFKMDVCRQLMEQVTIERL